MIASAITLAAAATAQPLFIDTVPVGNIGNAADPTTGFGAVNYDYRIGKYEVTNTQYAAFLNAVAATDPFGLYNAFMGFAPMGGITQWGTPGNFTYSVRPGYANTPVTFVSFWDAARFSNWMSTGYTEGRATLNGPLLLGAAYDLNFATNPTFIQGNRLAGSRIFVPSSNEWYKAAYHQPAAAGGDTDSYWLYPTGSNTQPTSAAPSAGTDRANYFYDDNIANGINGGYAITQSGIYNGFSNPLTDVGVYGVASESYYGTADQSGNVWEFDDSQRLRGGSWGNNEGDLRSSSGLFFDRADDDDKVGFRVASFAPIPEPGTYAAVAGVVALACVAWRRRLVRR